MTEITTAGKILTSFSSQTGHTCYIFGSQYEGSLTLHMGSDVDSVFVSCQSSVVYNISDCSDPVGSLLIPDLRFPVYANLQLIYDGRLQLKNNLADILTNQTKYEILNLEADNQNRLCLVFKCPSEFLCSRGLHRQGPALLHQGTAWRTPSYLIFAYSCDTWPPLAAEWLSRRRGKGLPFRELITKCKTLGVLVVQAFHSLSDQTHLQWRVSFSHQERALVIQITSVQMKCYVQYIK